MTVSSNIMRVFANSRVPLTLADPNLPDAPLILVNQPFCLLTGYEKSEVVGRNCRLLQGPKRDQIGRGEVHDALEQGIDTQVLLHNYTREQEEFENLLFVYHIRDADRKTVYFLGSQFKIVTRESAAALDFHMLSLRASLDDIDDRTHRVKLATHRQISASLATALRSSVIQERLSSKS